jgi:hypothetical protein
LGFRQASGGGGRGAAKSKVAGEEGVGNFFDVVSRRGIVRINLLAKHGIEG